MTWRSKSTPNRSYLGELALDIADKVLKPHCYALIKVFQGAGLQELVQAARGGFARVKLHRPLSAGPERRDVFAGYGLSLGVGCINPPYRPSIEV